MAEETRPNNGFSLQVSSYQQEALNLGFFQPHLEVKERVLSPC